MPNLAILTNGGDTCALNASIEAIRKEAHRIGFAKVIGVIGGYHGLLHDNCQTLISAVEERRGGSILRSLRESPVHLVNGKYQIDNDKVDKMVKTLKERDIDVLVVIGGDGTLQATKLFQQSVQDRHQFKIMGFPKTIDNDIRTKTHFEGIEVALCPGYPTAVRNISQATNAIRTTAVSAQRVFGVETMGRDAGWLAAAAYIGAPGPDMILIPEVPLDESAKQRLIQRTKMFFDNNLHVVIVVSEGTKWADEHGNIVQISTDEFGPRKLGGVVNTVMHFIAEKLSGEFDDSKPFGVRPHHTDYVPRAGSPCEYDLKLVHILAKKLGKLLMNRQYGRVPILRTVVPYDKLSVDCTDDLDIDEMEQMLFPAKDLYDEDRFLPNKTFADFLCTILSGPDTER